MSKKLIGILIAAAVIVGAFIYYQSRQQPPEAVQEAAVQPESVEPAPAPEPTPTPTGDKLNIYNWSDYIAEDTEANFEKETGVAVQYDVYDSNETLEAKMMAGGSGYDIVVPTNAFLGRQIQAGIYQEIDPAKIPNYKNIDPAILAALEPFDPGNKHAVPWFWGTTGVGYNVDAVKQRMPDAPMGSWDMVFKPEIAQKFADCGISFLDAPSEILQLALHYLGKDPHSTSEEDYAAAEALLMSVRPYIKYFHSSSYINDIANGGVCVSVGWSGDFGIAASAAEEAKNGITIEYTIPKEGTIIWIDSLVVPADAQNVENAYKWMDYNLRPEIAAANANYVAYGSPVAAAMPLIDKELLDNPNIYPTAETKTRLFPDKIASSELERLRTRTWTRIKTGQ
jgi:putrescine transport system substrate-binding protein